MTTNNPFIDYELRNCFDQLIKLQAKYAKEKEQALSVAGLGVSTGFKPLKQSNIKFNNARVGMGEIHVQNVYYITNDQSTGKSYVRLHELEYIEQTSKKQIDAASTYLDAIELENVDVIAHNDNLHTQITNFMTRLGINPTFVVYEKVGRSTKETRVEKQAGYLQDLYRLTPKSNVAEHRERIKQIERDVANWIKDKRECVKRELEATDQETMRKLVNRPEIAIALARVGIDAVAEIRKAEPGKSRIKLGELLENARKIASQGGLYLSLAYGLQTAKNLDEVAYAITLFEINSQATETDKQVVASVIERLHSKTSVCDLQYGEWSIADLYEYAKTDSPAAYELWAEVQSTANTWTWM